MAKQQRYLVFAVFSLVTLALIANRATAQSVDPGFEKLAKELYPTPIISAQQLGIYGKAPHINGAKLFAEWMIAPEGPLAVSAVGREVSRKGMKSKASIESAWGSNVTPIPLINKAYSEDPRKWLDTNVKPVWEN